MKTDKTSIQMSRRAMSVSIIAFAVLYAVDCLVIPPIYTLVVSDIALSGSILPELLIDLQILLEIIAISVCYAAMIYTVYIAGADNVKRIFAVFGIATFGKYAVNVVYSWISDGSIPRIWIWNIVDAAFFTALEFLQLLIIYAIVKRIIESFTDRQKITEKDSDNSLSNPYPFSKLYDKDNCLLRSAGVCGTVVFAAKLFGRVISDIWIMLWTGLPQKLSVVISMLLTYVSFVIFGIICYFAVYLMMSAFLKRTQR